MKLVLVPTLLLNLLVLSLSSSTTNASSSSSSPPVKATVQASWPAAPIAVQYLETLSLESPSSLFPFLHFLLTHPPLTTSKPPTYSLSTLQLLSDPSILPSARNRPTLLPQLQPNETFALLEHVLTRSGLVKKKGIRESLRLAIGARERSVVLEGMRLVEEQRWRELVETRESEEGRDGDGVRECESWLDVGGKIVCSEEEFWELVGVEQKMGKGPVVLPTSTSSQPQLYSFDHFSPSPLNPTLPLIILYASPVSLLTEPPLSLNTKLNTFSDLFTFIYSLSKTSPPSSNPKNQRSPAPRVQLALRWSRGAVGRNAGNGGKEEERKLVLSGYGAGLDIKKSDYLAIDDRLSAGGSGSGAATKEREEEEDEEATPKMIPVKKSDISGLGLRATTHILTSTSPLRTFTTLTSSFPLLASHLSTLIPEIPHSLEHELNLFQSTSPLSQRPSFQLNGLPLPESSVDPFALLRLMRKERKIINDLLSLSSHFSAKQVRDVLMFEGIGSVGKPPGRGREGEVKVEQVLGELFDAGDRREGGGAVVWWNDLEKDKRYKEWSKDLKDILRPVYPGQLNLIRRNLNNLILVLDFSRPSSLNLIAQNVRHFVSRGIPLRIGVVPQVGDEEDDVSSQVALVLWYLVENVGRSTTMSFCGDLAIASSESQRVTSSLLRDFYTQLASQTTRFSGEPLASFDEVVSSPIDEEDKKTSRWSKARAWTKRLAVEKKEGDAVEGNKLAGAFFLNGAHFTLDEEWTQTLQRSLGTHIQFLQQMIYTDQLVSSMNVNTYFYDLPTTHERRNPFIFPGADGETNPLRIVNLVDAVEGLDQRVTKGLFVEGVSPEQLKNTSAEAETALASLYIVTDLDSEEGRELAKSALKLVDKTTGVRISLLHNPSSSSSSSAPHAYSLSTLLYQLQSSSLLSDALPSELLSWLDLNLSSDGPQSPEVGKKWSDENPLKRFLKSGAKEVERKMAGVFRKETARFVERLGFEEGENGIVINGRVVGPFEPGTFVTADLKALLNFELQKRILPVVNAFESTSFNMSRYDSAQKAHIYNLATSVVSEAYLPDPAAGMFGGNSVDRRTDYRSLEHEHSSYIGPHENGALFEIVVVVDPLSELAQRWAPIIETLSTLETVHLRLHLNPSLHLTDLPIKRFYQYSFAPTPSFDAETGQELQPSIQFSVIPEDVLLTFSADFQQSWLAFPKTSVHDLDNIRLADLPNWSRKDGVDATFELETIVVEGHAREVVTNSPPRGLQVELLDALGTMEEKEKKRGDTIVMSNLGYFQLKASPGPFRLGIRQGKSSDVYSFESIGAEGWKSGDVSKTGDSLLVSTLEGLTLYPRLGRNPGYETVQLLDEKEVVVPKNEGLVQRIKNMFPFLSPASSAVATKKQAEINVFTVASGLLYERMAFLMMVSVMRHTQSTVKFWFISNFLSPSFRAFIPHMATEYGFEYELVTYKWPHWLRAQKEKQRTIWGYKILFLDVLFPLELDRVIFVDSDQIVRADLKELIDMDLKGAPYAYAPMGNDRPEMEGFRFWNKGYWKEHLQGKPYHISALYLVDLARFRTVAAGDRLRQQYQGLSADPHSLANLDQDLPNNMQGAIPIHTLDKNWLWCETWCSDESLATAKTIDLCNNPLTHEPKLQRAKRLIPEWTVYDDEVAALAQRVAAEESEIGAFGKKADDLEQAVQQSVERDEFVESQEGGEEKKGDRRVKDEL